MSRFIADPRRLTVSDNGDVYATGLNTVGGVGAGNESIVRTPLRVGIPVSVRQAASGYLHTLFTAGMTPNLLAIFLDHSFIQFIAILRIIRAVHQLRMHFH